MYFNKIQLSAHISQEQRLEKTPSDAYAQHQQIWRFFPGQPDANRHFLFRHLETETPLTYYLISEQRPIDTSHMWSIQTKEYTPMLESGQVFTFSLKANPTIKKKEAPGKKGKRHDVIMNAKRQWQAEHPGQSPMGQTWQTLITEASLKWLQRKGDFHGFEVDTSHFFVETYRQERSDKKKKKRSQIESRKPIRISTVNLVGVLRVIDPDSFKTCLFEGVGSAKGLGYGLLLIRPFLGGADAS